MPDPMTFDWADPLDLESQLSDEERMVRDAARGFAQDILQPRVIDAFRDELSAPEIFPLMGQAGLLGVTMPEEHGGAGAGYVAYGLVAREIEREFGATIEVREGDIAGARLLAQQGVSPVVDACAACGALGRGTRIRSQNGSPGCQREVG